MTAGNTSLCIPRIDSNVTKEYIMNSLHKMNIGQIEKITELPLKNNPAYKRILICVKWNDDANDSMMEIKNRLLNNETIKLVHNMPWYWKMVIAQTKK